MRSEGNKRKTVEEVEESKLMKHREVPEDVGEGGGKERVRRDRGDCEGGRDGGE